MPCSCSPSQPAAGWEKGIRAFLSHAVTLLHCFPSDLSQHREVMQMYGTGGNLSFSFFSLNPLGFIGCGVKSLRAGIAETLL